MMADTYEQNADGSANPTGNAEPAETPMEFRGPDVEASTTASETDEDATAKVVEAPAKSKPKGQTTASTKAKKA